MTVDMAKFPHRLKGMSISELEKVGSEIRSLILETVSKTGGHLAPSLGVVELTVVLHYLYNTPLDKIVWDVGHQAYAHKILTGRKDQMHTLRQLGGICGFPKISESQYDAFGVGHTSTSISAALGIATARDYLNEHFDVIAVIGDGALTGGLAFEGLNNAGASSTDITIIVNDNQMSISPNVGALHHYFDNVRKKSESNPNIDVMALVKEGIFTEGFFQNMGLVYLGPVDGHNIPDLIEILEHARTLKGPRIVHVLTRKGKGYEPAEKNPTKFHGTAPFDIQTGKVLKKSTYPTFTNVFGDSLIKLAEQDDKIVAITAGMPTGTGLDRFAERFPNRFFDVGIAEAHAVTFAAGLATQGLKPVVAIYSSFLQRAYDQLIHDVALQKLPVIFCLDRAGLVGDDGPTHHGAFDLSYLRSIPNMTIMAPKDENELQHMLYTATLFSDGPVAIRYPRGEGFGVQQDPVMSKVSIGSFEKIKSGSDIAILGLGTVLYEALTAAKAFSANGLDISVYNARFLKPIQQSEIKALCDKYQCIVTLEEGTIKGGLANEVSEHIVRGGFQNIELIHCGLKDQFVEQGDRSYLVQQYGLNCDQICEKIANSRTFVSLAIQRGLFATFAVKEQAVNY